MVLVTWVAAVFRWLACVIVMKVLEVSRVALGEVEMRSAVEPEFFVEWRQFVGCAVVGGRRKGWEAWSVRIFTAGWRSKEGGVTRHRARSVRSSHHSGDENHDSLHEPLHW